LGLQALIDLIGILVFALTAIALMYMSELKTTLQPLLFMTIVWAVVSLRLVLLVSRFILAPKTGRLRTVPLSDHAARAIHTRVLLVAIALVFGRAVSQFSWGSGLDVALFELIVITFYSITPVIIVAIIWQARAPVAALLGRPTSGDGGVSPLRQSLAANWHLFASAYVLALFVAAVLVAIGAQRDVLSALVTSWLLLVIIPAADAGLQALVVRLFRPRAAIAATPGADEPEAEGTAPDETGEGTYEAVALRNLRILLALLVVCVFAMLWHIDMMGFAEAFFGSRLADALIDTSVAVLMAYAVWGFVKAAVERNVALETRKKDEQESEGEGGGPGATRLATLLPLLRKFVVITLTVMVVLIAISSLGVNIGPLIAGAGVVGIAIGFGAQTLVKDIFSGLFFLIDDAFRMGEYVEIEKTRGRVEQISIRSLQLRHHNGPVHTIPFGEIRQLTNYSRDWIIMKFELRLPFESNINRVRKIIKKIGQEMMQDPELAPMMLEPLKSQGVTHMDDSALIVRCKFMAKPGQQFMVRRVAFMRIQEAFADAGIHFAPRRVIVETATPGEAVQAAASAIAAEQEDTTKPGKPRLI
jgi:small-conductance mechanosensitive channel